MPRGSRPQTGWTRLEIGQAGDEPARAERWGISEADLREAEEAAGDAG